MDQRPVIIFLICIFSLFINYLNAKTIKNRPESKIINGQKAKPGQFPFIVTINFGCAGSKKHVLTAGHCLSTIELDENFPEIFLYTIYFGRTHLQNDLDWNNTRNSNTAILHEDYKLEGLPVNDIAIIVLDNPIQYTEKIQPVQLPNADELDDLEGKILTAMGWGVTEEGRRPQDLMYVNLVGVSQEQCQEELNEAEKEEGMPSNLDDGMLCADSVKGVITGICYGDSGGPLVLNGTNIIVGVSSWGSNGALCTDKYNPDGFVRVSYYLDWIHSKIDTTQ